LFLKKDFLVTIFDKKRESIREMSPHRGRLESKLMSKNIADSNKYDIG
jgi:hypothetical protein